MLRTVSIPVVLEPDRFLPLMKQCAEIFNTHVDWALGNHTYNKNKAHTALYGDLRQAYPEIPSALVQTVRDTALEAVKATKFKRCPRKKSTSALRYDQRTMTLRGHQLTLSCIGKRAKVILSVPEYFSDIFETWDFKGGMLTYSHRQFRVQLVFEHPTPEQRTDGRVQGIDRGLYHLAVTSDSQPYSSAKIRSIQRRHLYNRRTSQAKGTRSATRRLKAMSGKEQRFSRDTNHVVTKKLANQPRVTTFVLEDLSGIRNRRRGKKMNKWLGSWSFWQFELFLAYKAESLGKLVAFVDPRHTSQKCSQCGHIYKGNRRGSRFHCVRCGFHAHADVNAAINIRDTYILSTTPTATVEQAVVNPPDVTSVLGQAPASVTSYPACPGSS